MRKSCVVIIMLFGAGCTQVSHETSVVGERTNQQGEVIQQVVRERTVKTRPVLLAPDGPTHSIRYEDKYFLRTKDNSRHEVPTVREDAFRNCGVYRPVDGSPLWVGAGINPLSNENTGHVAVIDGRRLLSHNENDLHVVVFDDRGIAAHRTFSVVPKWESSEEEFTFTNGNRTILFRSPGGAMSYTH